MKKICKIAIVFLIILSLYSTVFNVQALDIWQTGNKFLHTGADASDTEFESGGVITAMSGIVDFLWGLGLLIVFIATIVLGIKYMLVSPDEKSRVKQATTPYIIGVVIIFGAVTIWKLVIDLLEGSMMGW